MLYAEAYAPGFDDMRRRKPVIEKLARFAGYQPSTPLREIIRIDRRRRLPEPRRDAAAARRLRILPGPCILWACFAWNIFERSPPAGGPDHRTRFEGFLSNSEPVASMSDKARFPNTP